MTGLRRWSTAINSSEGPKEILSSERVPKGSAKLAREDEAEGDPPKGPVPEPITRRRRKNKRVTAIIIMATTTPITIPAIAPPEIPPLFLSSPEVPVEVLELLPLVVEAESEEVEDEVLVGTIVTKIVVWPEMIEVTVVGGVDVVNVVGVLDDDSFSEEDFEDDDELFSSEEDEAEDDGEEVEEDFSSEVEETEEDESEEEDDDDDDDDEEDEEEDEDDEEEAEEPEVADGWEAPTETAPEPLLSEVSL